MSSGFFVLHQDRPDAERVEILARVINDPCRISGFQTWNEAFME